MKPWLAVRGVGLAYADALWQERCLSNLTGTSAPCLAGVPDLHDGPSLTELPDILRAFYDNTEPPPLRRIPRFARMGLLAALRAMNAAGWKRDNETKDTALIIGSAWGSTCMSMDFMDSMLDQGPRLSSPTAFSHAVNNTGAGLVSLLLNIQGTCQTVSQFELSFAGALLAAGLELGTGRARRALVGALDETDTRFTRCCPKASGGGIYAHEGGIFLCLEHAGPELLPSRAPVPHIRVHWGGLLVTPGQGYGQNQGQRLDPKTNILHSGAAKHPQGICLENHYGRGPLAQALDVCFALRQKHRFLCRCQDDMYGHGADVEVEPA